MRASIILEFSDSKLLANSLKPDVRKKSRRVKESIRVDKGKLVITLDANDVSSLKASVNSYLSFIQMALNFRGGEK